jgi:hypothetical protein
MSGRPPGIRASEHWSTGAPAGIPGSVPLDRASFLDLPQLPGILDVVGTYP